MAADRHRSGLELDKRVIGVQACLGQLYLALDDLELARELDATAALRARDRGFELAGLLLELIETILLLLGLGHQGYKSRQRSGVTLSRRRAVRLDGRRSFRMLLGF